MYILMMKEFLIAMNTMYILRSHFLNKCTFFGQRRQVFSWLFYFIYWIMCRSSSLHCNYATVELKLGTWMDTYILYFLYLE